MKWTASAQGFEIGLMRLCLSGSEGVEKFVEHLTVYWHLLNVRFVKTMLVFLLALAWAPLTAHCQLEIIPGFEFLACASHCAPHSNSQAPDSDACCAVEYSHYKPEDHQPLVFPECFVLLLEQTPAEQQIVPLIDARSDALVPVQPELLTSWQFFFRTALPVRAPSIAS